MIRLLPQEMRSCFRSGIAIPSIVQCVEELVLNAVDAQATCIAVRVDIPNCRIQVVDNGKGLSKEDFELIGHRYATSKCRQLSDPDDLRYFGFRGESLASIIHISRMLEIVSRAKRCDITLSKLFHDSKSEVFETPAKRPSVGTTVTVHGIFHRMPVRRKITSDSLDYGRVCQSIESLALIHPHVSFSLRDDSTGTKSIQTYVTSSVINTFRCLFGQSQAKGLKEVTYQCGTFSLSGYMSVEGHHNKSLQFIYVNSRLVVKTRLHKAINYLLRKSLITHYRPVIASTEMSPTELSNSPCSATNLYGVFVLNIKCPLSEFDICLEPSKSWVEFKEWSEILNCIEQLVDRFLTRENLTMKKNVEKCTTSLGDNSNLMLRNDYSHDKDLENPQVAKWGGCSSVSQKYGKGISASSRNNTLQSLTVRRPPCKLACESASNVFPKKTSSNCVCHKDLETLVSEAKENSKVQVVLDQISSEEDVAKDKPASEEKEIFSFDSCDAEHPSKKKPGECEKKKNLAVRQPFLTSAAIDTCMMYFARTDHLLNECKTEAKQQMSIGDSDCNAVSTEVNVKPELKVEMQSEESKDVLGMSCLSEYKENSQKLSRGPVALCIQCEGCDICDQVSPPGTGEVSQTCDLKNKRSCKVECTKLLFDKTSSVQQEGSKRAEQIDFLENCLLDVQVNNGDTSSTSQEQNKSEGYDCLLSTSRTRTPHKLENVNKRLTWNHKTSLDSSSSSDVLGCDSECDNMVSNSNLLIKKDKIHDYLPLLESPSLESKDNVRKESQINEKDVHVHQEITDVKPTQHVIYLKSVTADGKHNIANGTSSSPCQSVNVHASSLQMFKKSIQGNCPPDLTLRKDNNGASTSEFTSKWTEVQIQSGNTTSVPRLLKRRFTHGFIMHENDAAKKSLTNQQILMQVPVHRVSGIDPADCGNALVKNSNMENVENEKTPHFYTSAKKPRIDNENARWFPDNFESLQAAETIEAFYAPQDHGVNAQDQAYVEASELKLEEKEWKDTEHDGTLQRPNLKRLKQSPVTLVSIASDVEIQNGVVINRDQESKILEKTVHEPLMQSFATSDDFIQPLERLLQPIAFTKNSVLEKDVPAACVKDPTSLSAGTHKDKQLGKPADTNTVDSSWLTSVANSHIGMDFLSLSAEIDDGLDALPMETQEKEFISDAEILFKRAGTPCCSNHVEEKTLRATQLSPSCAQTHSVAALETIFSRSCCQEIPRNHQDTSSGNLPAPVVHLLGPDIRKLKEKKLLDLTQSDSTCVIPHNEAIVCLDDASHELTKQGLPEGPICGDNESGHATEFENAPFEYLTSNSDTNFSASVLDKTLVKQCHMEEGPTQYVCESVLVTNNHDGNPVNAKEYSKRRNDTQSEEIQRESVTTLSTNACCFDHSLKSVSSLDGNTTICPSAHVYTFCKKRTSKCSANMRKQVEVDLRTGNCHLERSHGDNLRSLEDAISQEETVDIGYHQCPVIRPIERYGKMDQVLDNWTNPMFSSLETDITDAQSAHLPQNCVRMWDTFHPYKFPKTVFQGVKVLDQVDNKFIACMGYIDENKAAEPNLLLMIDQHAAHERVRLEQLVSDIFEAPVVDAEDCQDGIAKQSQLKSSAVIPPVVLILAHKELQLLQSSTSKLKRLGISYRIVDGDGANETEGSVEITRLPSCLVEREAEELSRGRQPVATSVIQALLEEYLQELQRTAGASAVLPKTVTNILKSQACHGAIKFGEPLNHCECSSLISQLSQCDLPFQCAHGRPSVIPLLDFRLLSSSHHDKVHECKPRLWHLHKVE